MVRFAFVNGAFVLEYLPRQAYIPDMVDTTTHAEIPAGWLESLDRSQAQAEAGETVPLEPVLDRLRASIGRMKTTQSPQDHRTARKA